jgi:hypothetical protein
VFKVAFDSWIADADERDLPEIIRESMDALQAVTADRR